MYVVVSAAVTGANCSMEVETRSSSPMVTDGFVLTSGVNAYHLTNASALPSPGTRKISKVKFTCDATASMALDWFSIQNAASVVFPPSADVQVVWDDLDITGGGRHNAVRQSLSGMMYAASDGGIGIWDPLVSTDEWHFASGFGASGIPSYQRYISDVAGVDDADAVWDWHVNTPTADAAGCRVTQAGFDGLTGSDWSDEVFFWGGYTAEYPGATPNGWLEYGGVCALDLDTGAITSVISPSTSERTYEYQFADVAASPNVSDLLLVTGRTTPASMIECREPVGAGPLSNAFCPSSTPPLLVTRDASGTWQSVPLRDVPPTDAGLAVSWATGESERLYLSTENAGAWKGSVTW